MRNYKLVNVITGWAVFLIATITYLLTLEPTTSLWDCGEFITTSCKLEVGHPPGAPLFMIIARVFSMFGNNEAFMVNVMSGLCSSFTILFLFWTITHLAKKIIIKKDEELSLKKLVIIMGSGVVGALAYTYSDTFWFSAVEAEVYAMSSLFTAVVFWAILKWENEADEKYSNRWIILIAYLMGLSIGVHLLNLLAIPAIAFVYYFRKYKATKNGIIATFLLSCIILATIMYGVIPGVVTIATWFELMFVNGFGAPFNTGVLIYAALMLGGIAYGIHYSLKKRMVILNTILTSLLVIIIGYSSFAMVVIRSNANPPIDENNPENVFSLLSYLNREQYGDRPLVTGQYHTAPVLNYKDGKKLYVQKDGKYKVSLRKTEYEYDERFTTVFPRMYSDNKLHASAYKQWAGTSGKMLEVKLPNGETERRLKPSFMSNLKFFFSYQLNFMYFRYFLWNFSGRQNDIQCHGSTMDGNWITGINFIDKFLVGDQENLPKYYKDHKSRNKYYLLPLLLGILGMIIQYKKSKKSKKDFWVVMLLFFFTGIAIVLYLNQTPYQPRERDYAYAGSFYAFAIWIGLGVLWLFDFISRKLPKAANLPSAIAISLICLLVVPINMACENWDDHDRSNRYTTLAYAKNYLNSCDPNAILFTYGDNDTFPLWYAQEIEGIRKDIRIVNLSLLGGDWYITQMKRDNYKAKAIPITMKAEQYTQGKREYTQVFDRLEGKPLDLRTAVDFTANDDKRTMVDIGDKYINYFPATNLTMKVDKAKVLKNGIVAPEDAALIDSVMTWNIKKSHITKSDLAMLDLIEANNWERPIYWGIGMGSESFCGLEDYLQLEGTVLKLVPIKKNRSEIFQGRINTKSLYDKLMNKFEWGGLNKDNVYIDQFNKNTIRILRIRSTFYRLAQKLIKEGKKEKAIEVIDRCMKEFPEHKIPFDRSVLSLAHAYYMSDATEKANAIIKRMLNTAIEHILYYATLNESQFRSVYSEYDDQKSILETGMDVLKMFDQKKLLEEFNQKMKEKGLKK